MKINKKAFHITRQFYSLGIVPVVTFLLIILTALSSFKATVSVPVKTTGSRSQIRTKATGSLLKKKSKPVIYPVFLKFLDQQHC